jgi:hypothetical protein
MGALATLITGGSKRTLLRDKDDKADILLIDVTTKLTPQFESEATDFPVEDGQDITDHVRVKPIRITVEGSVSQTPLSWKQEVSGLITSGSAYAAKSLGGFGQSAGAVVGGALGANILKLNSNSQSSPAMLTFQILTDLIQNKRRFTLVDQYRRYTNLVMTSLTFPQDPKTGQKIDFSFTCKQIKVVSSQSTTIHKVHKDAAHSAGKTEKKGQQGAQEAQDGSLAYKGASAGWNALKGLVGGG